MSRALRVGLRAGLALVLLAAGGCKPKGKDLLAKDAAAIADTRARMARIAKALDASPPLPTCTPAAAPLVYLYPSVSNVDFVYRTNLVDGPREREIMQCKGEDVLCGFMVATDPGHDGSLVKSPDERVEPDLVEAFALAPKLRWVVVLDHVPPNIVATLADAKEGKLLCRYQYVASGGGDEAVMVATKERLGIPHKRARSQ